MLKYDIESMQTSIVVPVVDSPSSKYDFPGVYSFDISQNCWSVVKGNILLFLSSSWRSRQVILAVDIQSGTVQNITPGGLESWTFYAATPTGRIVASRSDPTSPGALMITQFTGDSKITWTELDTFSLPKDISAKLSCAKVQICDIPGRGPEVEVILIKPSAKKSPLIVMPHGGPHSAFTSAFSNNIAGFVSLGYACMLVNYTGSTGFGQLSVQKLVGQIGSLDVSDVHSAAVWATKLDSVVSNRVYLFGGRYLKLI